MIQFTVRGLPVPQGSKRVFGKAVVESNESRLRPWRLDVASSAHEAMNGAGPHQGPVEVILRFSLPRPKSHFGTGRNKDVLKASAPAYPTGKPDIDKLARAVLDAISQICFRDDSQVARLDAIKQYADPVGLECFVAELY